MVIFGFNNENEFSRDEFHFFLDCLFRGFFKLLIVPSENKDYMKPATSIWSRKKLAPLHSGRKISSADLEKLVSQVFPPNIEVVERSDFIELM